eukprot:5635479-Amphidinium_carterae.1
MAFYELLAKNWCFGSKDPNCLASWQAFVFTTLLCMPLREDTESIQDAIANFVSPEPLRTPQTRKILKHAQCANMCVQRPPSNPLLTPIVFGGLGG